MKIQLPKNVRQIGEGSSDVRVYLEDYVITLLQQMKKYDGQRETAVTLYGRREQDEECVCYLVYGAVIKEDTAEPEKLQSVFPAYQIIGEAIVCAEGAKPEQLLHFHGRALAGSETLLFLVGENGDNLAAILSMQGTRRLGGYYIFYDKNEVMQSILLDWYSAHNRRGPEEEKDDAVRQFRERYENRQEEAHQKKLMNALYMVSLLLVMLCCITGISMMNQYDKMLRMEQTMEHLALAMRERELPEREVVGADAAVPEYDAAASVSAVGSAQAGAAASGGQADAAGAQAQTETGQQADILQAGGAETADAQMTAQDTQTADLSAQTQDTQTADSSAPAQDAQPATARQEIVYIVKAGDTLAAISQSYYGTWKNVPEICAYNQIEDPNNIHVGQKLLLP